MFQTLPLSKLVGAALLSLTLAGCVSTGNGPNPTPPADPGTPEVTDCASGAETLPSLEIPAGKTCDLISTIVEGDLTISAGASLDAYAGAEVKGNIQGQGAKYISLDGVIVGGDVRLVGGAAVNISNGTVTGSVELTGNSDGDGVSVSDTVVEGDLQVSQNTGGVFISTNVISGNLQCEGNNPAPEGEENAVTGSKSGQCSGL